MNTDNSNGMPHDNGHTAVVTVATSDYLHYAWALAAAVRRHNATTPVYVCVVDRPDAPIEVPLENVQIFLADELGIPNWRRFAFQYTATELSCALKPHALRYALTLPGVQQAIYLDADIQVYGNLISFAASLADHDIILTPHVTEPLPDDGCLPSDLLILQAGIFNGGMLAVRNSTTGLAFLEWWSAKTRHDCVYDVGSRMVVDQVWLEHVPQFFPTTHIERRPEFNVAYWNLSQRNVERDAAGNFTVDGRPLVTFHFSGYDPALPEQLSKYQNRLHLANLPAVRKLCDEYRESLRQFEAHVAGARYGFATLADGSPIDRAWREAVRSNHPLVADIEDPFAVMRLPEQQKRITAAGHAAALNRRDWQLEKLYDLTRLVTECESRLVQVETKTSSLQASVQTMRTIIDPLAKVPGLGAIYRTWERWTSPAAPNKPRANSRTD